MNTEVQVPGIEVTEITFEEANRKLRLNNIQRVSKEKVVELSSLEMPEWVLEEA